MLALFDFDDTLVSRSAAIWRWAHLLVRTEGMPQHAVEAIVDADRKGATPRDEFLDSVLSLPGIRMTMDEFRNWYAVSYPSCYGPEEDSIRALTLFRDAGWKIGVVTNGSAARTEQKLARSGLAPLIDALCVAEDLGVCKPDRRIFEEAARRCGAELTGWMIGDAPVEDVAGGAQAGLRTAWLRGGRTWNGRMPRPDIEVDSVLEAAVVIVTSSRHTRSE
ncbi:HAD family hydrolase [Streptomyces viridochromogenes]|uniref:HAD family hydrolase n=1 Tax=Streptomyces viridochromogenes TaxID=1938 RepID=UPI00065C7C1A|nr:HAD family hydrolase [Streptomyces viridochromogenes]